MQIKRLELQGFKSFRDRTVIHFDDGITGIVGPNGCGKSNVVDAFFWVMGEQNARLLRGQAMDDLIFSGSDKSPPANYAEVALILDMPGEIAGPSAPAGASVVDVAIKPAMREVNITRRLYRSGESEYFLNQTPCRLRDIQELFMDTGVGARGYSIIQQGQIAKIVQAKPEDRRTMIEEVAGIVKYKTRRRESMRKLESTHNNLLRVTDIINELEGQKRMMERQAEKARKYKDWKTRLHEIELRFNALKWEDLSIKIGEIDSAIEGLSAEETAFSTARESAETTVAQKRLEATQAGKVLEELQQKWMRAGQELNDAENDHKYSIKNRDDLQLAIQQMEADLAQITSETESLRTEHAALEVERETIADQFGEASEKLRAQEQSVDSHRSALDGLERNTDEVRSTLSATNADLARLRNQLEFAARRISELGEEIERTNAQKQEREHALQSAEAARNASAQELLTARDSFEQTSSELSNVNSSLATIRGQLEENRRALARLASEQAKVNTTLNSLEEQKRRHEDSGKGVKAIFQNILPLHAEWKDNILGTLADFLNVEKGMEVAAETALGRHLEIILTRDASIQSALSAELKSAAAGRASFADISKTLGSLMGNENKLTDPSAQPLSQFVRMNEASNEGARALLTHLLGDVYVAESRDAAMLLAEQHQGLSFVTRDGELFRGGWFLEGGDLSSVSGHYVGRNREIEELRASLANIETNIASTSSEVASTEALLSNEETRKIALEQDVRTKQALVSRLSTDEASNASRMQELARALDHLNQDLSRREAEKSRFMQEQETSQQALAEKENARLLSEQELSMLSNTLVEARAKNEELQQALVQVRVAFAEVQSRKNSIDLRTQQSETALNQRTSRMNLLSEQVSFKRHDLGATENHITEVAGKVEELRQALIGAESEQREARNRLEQVNHELQMQMDRVQEESKRERSVHEALSTKRLDHERVNSEREHLVQNTFERYGINLAEHAIMPETQEQVQLLRSQGDAAVAEAQNEVNLLKEKIRKLGEVNTGAIEEYDVIVERYNFLGTQKADLEKSMADLQNTVERINKVSRERFSRAFEEVNTQFRRVFPVIFGGGHAHLTLTNPEDLLETGVDITAQPPGKKPQNINLLSGGEKTLTAISLLFAIFLVKPSPFCLLDEVDAPLDDANIGRFNALLKEMAKRSQFIIITHNKRTMELNDKLYGVTMEDAGISKMVSIQLTA